MHVLWEVTFLEPGALAFSLNGLGVSDGGYFAQETQTKASGEHCSTHRSLSLKSEVV